MNRQTFRSSALVRLLAPLALLSVLSTMTAHAQDTVRIGLEDRLVHALLSLGANRGDFSAEGLDVRFEVLDSAADPRGLQRLARGELDLLATTADALLTAAATGIELRGALLLGRSADADVVFGAPGTDAPGALRGTRIGVASGAPGRLLLAAQLQRRGLNLDEVTLVPLSAGEAGDAWLGGGDEAPLDALVIGEPALQRFTSQLSAADEARSPRSLGDASRPSGLLTDVLAGEERWLRDNRDTVKRLVRGWDRTVGALRGERSGALDALAELLELPVDAVRAALSGVRLYSVDDNIIELRGNFQKTFSTMSRVLARIEREGARGVPSANRYLALSALRQVAAGR